MPFIIGLDVGSSSIKAALLDLDSLSIVTTSSQPFPSPLAGKSNRHEVDAEEVVARCRAVVETIAKSASVDAIYFCGQHGGAVPVDPATRRAIGPYISWRDERSGEPHPDRASTTYFNRVRDLIGDEQLLRVGREFAPGGTTMMAVWLARHGKLPPQTALVGIGEYVLSRLTDTDPTIERTCAVGMMDLQTLAPPVAMYERLGIAQFTWPRIVEFREKIGEVRVGDRAIAAYPVVGDHQCALAGAAIGERELSINISTGSQVSLLTREAETSPDYQTRPYFDGLFLKTLTHLPAGRALNVLVDLLCELPRRAGQPIDNPWALLAPLLNDEAARSDLTVRTTFFKGPLGERGSIENISVNNLTAGAILRAALLDMASNYRVAAAKLGADVNSRSFDSLALSGGIAQKLLPLRTAIGHEFANRPIRVSQSEEETMQGLMALALVNSGRAKSVVGAAGMLRSKPASPSA